MAKSPYAKNFVSLIEDLKVFIIILSPPNWPDLPYWTLMKDFMNFLVGYDGQRFKIIWEKQR